MKQRYLFGALLGLVILAGCSSHPNNGEIPPASEIPTPYPTSSVAPAASIPAITTPAVSSSTGTPAPAGSTGSTGT